MERLFNCYSLNPVKAKVEQIEKPTPNKGVIEEMPNDAAYYKITGANNLNVVIALLGFKEKEAVVRMLYCYRDGENSVYFPCDFTIKANKEHFCVEFLEKNYFRLFFRRPIQVYDQYKDFWVWCDNGIICLEENNLFELCFGVKTNDIFYEHKSYELSNGGWGKGLGWWGWVTNSRFRSR